MFETIRIETDARGVARLTLARAAKHNTLSAKMIEELTQAAHLAPAPQQFAKRGNLGDGHKQFSFSAGA